MATAWSSQPFKAIFIVWFMLTALFRLTFLSLYYLPRCLRPVPQWSWKNCLLTSATKLLFRYLAGTRTQGPPQSEPGKAKERFVLAQPPPDHVFSGLLSTTHIRPAQVGGIWFPSLIQPTTEGFKNKKVILHFPGGAYVLSFDLNVIGPRMSKLMTQNLKIPNTFFAQYRLANGPDARFPAQLQDLVTFYHYVLSLGIEPRNVIISGDSAGGNIVIALMRYLHTSQSQLPLPGATLLFSPWVHVTANAGEDWNACNYSRADVLVDSILQWGVDAYLPERDDQAAEARPFISPLHHPYKTEIPVFIHAGDREAWYDSLKCFAQEMIELNGKQLVRFYTTEYAPHDVMLAHELIGFTEEMATALQDAYSFFNNQSS
ncbi:Alpha/Beta hydrolase protein [Xylariaceae sp. FL0662B]|nr:Alpha/Beta hydrolase protein [Xylariaceae sp. FL0662B]